MVSVPDLLVLGLLAERPWTAYELVRHLSSPSLASVLWDASERTLYRGPARLVERGLARSSDGRDGPAVYEITDAGRQALHDARPDSARFVHRNEILATLYAVAGAPLEDVRARLEQLRDVAVESVEETAALLREMAIAGPALPGRAIVTALLGRVHLGGVTLLVEWADEAIDAIDALDPATDPTEFASAEWARLADQLDEFLADRDTSRTAESTSTRRG